MEVMSVSLPCRARNPLHWIAASQAASMLAETPASPPSPSPARGEGNFEKSLRDFHVKIGSNI